MNTPAHLIVGAAAFGRRAQPSITVAAIIGALVPDVSLYVLSAWFFVVKGVSAQVVFNDLYFSDAWQSIFAIDNSFLLWGALLGVAVATCSRVGIAFSGAGLLHLLTDFLLHHEDARQMFWPLSTWVFRSPVSYWDRRHYGQILGPIEIAVSLALCVVVWRRERERRMRVLVVLLALAEVVPGVVFAIGSF
jgi:hypothetical protein